MKSKENKANNQQVSIDGEILAKCEVKYLGVIADNQLNWRRHTEMLGKVFPPYNQTFATI